MKRILIILFFGISGGSFAADPGWAVSPAAFDYSMTVTAVLQADCEELTNVSNRLGAFVGNEVRGSVLSSTEVNGKFIALLSVYSNSVAGESITFKIYNVDTDEIIDADNILAFQDDASYGTPTVPQLITDNKVPTNLTLSENEVNENVAVGFTVGNFTVEDGDEADSHTFSLIAGTGDTDNASFTIAGNELKIQQIPDFETKEEYNIRVRAQDAEGCFTEEAYVITVLNLNETPTELNLSNNFLDEGTSAPVQIGVLSSVDDDNDETFIYSLAAGTGDTDNSSFTINGDKLNTTVTFDFETKSSYSILVRTTDSKGAFLEQVFQIDVADVNEAPTDLSLSAQSINENEPANSIVGTFSVADQDAGDIPTIILFAGTGDEDNGSFTLVNSELKLTDAPDYETKSSYNIRIKVEDNGGNTIEQAYLISVVNLNETPTELNLSNTSLNEGNSAPTRIGLLSSVDDDDNETFTYSLVSGTGDTDNATFEIDGNQLNSKVSFDFETKSSYSILLRTTDSKGAFLEQVFQIDVVDINEAPTDLALSAQSINENEPANTLVGTFSIADQDAGDVPTIVLFAGTGDEDNGSFTLVNRELKLTNAPDFETKSSYNIRIKVEDNGGNTIEQAYVISVVDLNETPTELNLSNTSLDEGNSAQAQIGLLSSVDDDDNETFSYSLVSGTGDTDNASFQINGNQLNTKVIFDFETKSSYSILLRTTDSEGAFLEQAFQISITDVNEAPTDLSLSAQSINENEAANTLVGTFSVVDQDAGYVPTIILFAGEGDEDNGSFTLVNRELKLTEVPDFETKSFYNIRVKVEDNGGNTIEQAYVISVVDLNETPTELNLSNTSLNEGKLAPIRIGILSSVDDDNDETFDYSLVTGTGDTDNASFEISKDTLFTKIVFDYEMKSSYSILVRTTDSEGAFLDQVFTINVLNVNEPPYSMVLSVQSIEENQPANSLVGVFSVSDQDNPETLTFELLTEGVNDNSLFTLSGTDLLVNSSLNFESKNEYIVHASVKDSGEETLQQAFTISVINQEETPTDLSISATSVKENSEVPSVVATLSTTDDDLNEVFTYTLEAGTGSDDNAAFSINDSLLYLMSSVDFETKSSYSINIRTTDKSGRTYDESFVINVEDLNEGPYGLALSATTISENLPAGTTIGSLSVSDDDTGDVVIFSLDTTDSDHSYFTIVGSDLQIVESFNYENKNAFNITVIATDQSGASDMIPYVISVIDENDTPVNLQLSNLQFVEDQAVGSEVGVLSLTDEDPADTHTYSLAADGDNTLFVIEGNSLRSASVIDFDLSPTATITVTGQDNSGATVTVEFVITISEVSDRAFPSIDIVTPNGDGINDTWAIANVSDYSNYSVSIYNSGGQIIYQKGSEYQNDWDGSGFPAGTYYYLVRSNANGAKSFSGTLSLIK